MMNILEKNIFNIKSYLSIFIFPLTYQDLLKISYRLLNRIIAFSTKPCLSVIIIIEKIPIFTF